MVEQRAATVDHVTSHVKDCDDMDTDFIQTANDQYEVRKCNYNFTVLKCFTLYLFNHFQQNLYVFLALKPK